MEEINYIDFRLKKLGQGLYIERCIAFRGLVLLVI